MPNHALNDTHIPSMSVYMASNKATENPDPSKNSNCLFRYDTQLVANPDTQFLLGLTAAEIPYSFYNVGEISNFIRYQINGYSTTTAMVVPKGNYDVNSLVTQINSLLQPNTSISFDDSTNKFTFTNTVDGGIRIISSTMNKILGLAEDQIGNDLSFETSLECTNCCNIQGTSCVYVVVNNMSIINLDSRGDNNGVIGKIQMDGNPGDMCFYTQSENFYFKVSDPYIQDFDISLTDDDNQLVDFNGVDWSLTLTLHFQKIRLPEIDERFLLDGDRQPETEAETKADNAEEAIPDYLQSYMQPIAFAGTQGDEFKREEDIVEVKE